jgi:tetratricopeptide (TPR) repeat protein
MLAISVFVASLVCQESRGGESSVRIWQEGIVIPTYRLNPADKNPMFYTHESYQGAEKKIYPYPLLDGVTDIKEPKTYKAVYLENEYIRLSILPEIGGRLFSALDKTNNYEIFYHQHVIKPALIGMLGAWISGGIEWCVFHHHRNTTYMPVDYTLVENPDGSKTIWFGEVERRHRMKWVIGVTLYPGKSYIEATVKLFNRTPYPHSILYWANVAVHANEDYQVIFPPSVQFATYHSKNDFVHWPISNEVYRGVDYKGVDLSWWKNHPEPVSFFAWDLEEDFSGGYDHGKQAGVVHVGNHHTVCGAKLWEWSPGPSGRMWDKILTDANGPYAELMVGAFSDNQPDYSWIKPYETKTFKQYWYPVREIGGFKNANLNAAVNLELKPNNIAQVGFNATSQYDNATVLLTAGDKVILEQTTDIGPGKPFVKDVKVPAGTQETDLKVSLLTPAKNVLIAYQPLQKKYDPQSRAGMAKPLPQVVKAPPAPSEIENIEQLYLTGLRLEQIHNPRLDPYAYYEEALKRDPGDCRTNTILGVNYSKRGMFTKAEEHLRRAIERVSAEYTRPATTEAYYHLGLALKAQEKFDEAYDVFYRATWDYAFHSAAYYQLAELSCRKGEFAAALEQIDRSLSTNTLNAKALSIKAAILRHLGKLKQAKEIAASVTAADPLDFLAMNELYLAESASPSQARAQILRQELMEKMRGEVESYLELAIDYGNCGLWDDAIDVLGRAAENKPVPSAGSGQALSGVEGTTFAGPAFAAASAESAKYPMVYYYLAYFYMEKGDAVKASEYLSLAGKMPSDYCFPFRLESIKVLDFAIQSKASDARAHYYLGNLLYDLQPENAVERWEKSRQLDDSFAPVHRNLGWAYYRTQKNTAKAVASYEKAIACDKEDARLYAELDHLYEMANTRLQKRLALLQENHQTVVKRNDSFLREIMVLVLVGRYDEAISFLANNHFHVREGGGEIHDVYVDGLMLRGLLHLKDKRLKEALDDFRAASEYPENLSVGRPKNDRRAPQVAYYTGTAYEASGDVKTATEFYQKAASQRGTSQWQETRFYQGLALGKLGQEDAANKIFDELIEAGKAKLSQKIEVDFFAKFGEQQSAEAQKASAHYILGLGYLGKGERIAARSEFEKTVALDVSHVWAKAFLAQLD